MSHKLIHTAREIDHKLGLIDENKNLLPYPYIDSKTKLPIQFPAGLEDVGDGSILITDTIASKTERLLATHPLPVGKKYIVSLDFTNIVDTALSVNNPGFELRVEAGTSTATAKNDRNSRNASAELDLTNETGNDQNEIAALVYIVVPAVSDNGLVIKPQIEEAQVLADGSIQTTPTAWVPYMKTVGSYVDERFNSTNTKIKVLNNSVNELETKIDNIVGGGSDITIEDTTSAATIELTTDNSEFNTKMLAVIGSDDLSLIEKLCGVTNASQEELSADFVDGAGYWESWFVNSPNSGDYKSLAIENLKSFDTITIHIDTLGTLDTFTLYENTVDLFREVPRLQLWGFNSNTPTKCYYRTLPAETYAVDADLSQIIITNPACLETYLPSSDDVYLKIQWNTFEADNSYSDQFEWGQDFEGQSYDESVTVYGIRKGTSSLIYWNPKTNCLTTAPIEAVPEKAALQGGTRSQALSHNAFTYGFGNTAGGRGFRITAQEPILNEDGTKSGKGKYTLSSTDGIQNLLDNLGEGETLGYSVRLNSASYDRGIIESVDGDKIIVTNFPDTYKIVDEEYLNIPGTENFDETKSPKAYNYLMIVGHPELGDIVIGFNAVVFGENNIATDAAAVATGASNQALGQYSFTFGKNNVVGYCATAGGDGNTAKGPYTQAVGYKNTATGNYAHAEGRETNAIGESSHAEGLGTNANEKYAHAEGVRTNANGSSSHAEGSTTTAGGSSSHAEGYWTQARGDYSHTSGVGTIAVGEAQTAIGKYNKQDENALFIIGSGSNNNNRKNSFTVSESETIINGNTGINGNANVNGNMTVTDTVIIGGTSITETELANVKLQADWNNTVSSSGAYINNKPPIKKGKGNNSVELTPNVVASGNCSQAAGVTSNINTTAYKSFNEALEAWNTKNYLRAFGYGSHAEGINTIAYGQASHAEGEGSKASGWTAHAEGCNTLASGNYSHAGGLGTIAAGEAQTAIGKYNAEDSTALFVVGKGSGTADNQRSNAFAVYPTHTTAVAYKNDVACVRNIKVGTSMPNDSEGNDGDIYLMIEE